MVCLKIYRGLLSLATFLRVHSNSEAVSYLSWQSTYTNLKTTCRIKLKFLLRTKLLKNLLLAKYLISVATPLHFPKIIEVFSVKYNRSIAFLRRLWSQSMRIKFRQKYGLVMQNKYLYIIFSVLRKSNRHSWRLNKSSKTF